MHAHIYAHIHKYILTHKLYINSYIHTYKLSKHDGLAMGDFQSRKILHNYVYDFKQLTWNPICQNKLLVPSPTNRIPSAPLR